MAFFPIFRFPRLFIVFLGFSGFPQLLERVFRFPQLFWRVFRFPQLFQSFPAFRDLKMAFSGFRQTSLFRFYADYFGLFRFSATFLGLFRLSAVYLTPPLNLMINQFSLCVEYLIFIQYLSTFWLDRVNIIIIDKNKSMHVNIMTDRLQKLGSWFTVGTTYSHHVQKRLNNAPILFSFYIKYFVGTMLFLWNNMINKIVR